MKVSVDNAKTNLSELVQALMDGKESSIIITMNGKPVAQMTPVQSFVSKRLGAAKEEMKGFDISLEEFDSIPLEGFENYA